MINNKTHLTHEGFKLLLKLKICFSKGIRANIFKHFPDIITDEYINYKNTEEEGNINPHYIAGFTAADGHFGLMKPSAGTKWANYDATFKISPDKSDKHLLHRIAQTLNCGSINTDKNGMSALCVRNKKELVDIIIPFFETFPLNAQKSNDFLIFKLGVHILYKNKGKGYSNLTNNEIKLLYSYISKINKYSC